MQSVVKMLSLISAHMYVRYVEIATKKEEKRKKSWWYFDTSYMLLSCRAIYLLKGKMEIYDDSMERRGDDIRSNYTMNFLIDHCP